MKQNQINFGPIFMENYFCLPRFGLNVILLVQLKQQHCIELLIEFKRICFSAMMNE